MNTVAGWTGKKDQACDRENASQHSPLPASYAATHWEAAHCANFPVATIKIMQELQIPCILQWLYITLLQINIPKVSFLHISCSRTVKIGDLWWCHPGTAHGTGHREHSGVSDCTSRISWAFSHLKSCPCHHLTRAAAIPKVVPIAICSSQPPSTSLGKQLSERMQIKTTPKENSLRDEAAYFNPCVPLHGSSSC